MYTHFYSIDYVLRPEGKEAIHNSMVLGNTEQMDSDAILKHIKKEFSNLEDTKVLLTSAKAIDQATFIAKGGDMQNPFTKTGN